MLCKAALLACAVDLPVKGLVCNMKQYNGEYSCPACLDKGDNTITRSTLVRYWPYNTVCRIRTAEEVEAAFTKATKDGTPVCYDF